MIEPEQTFLDGFAPRRVAPVRAMTLPAIAGPSADRIEAEKIAGWERADARSAWLGRLAFSASPQSAALREGFAAAKRYFCPESGVFRDTLPRALQTPGETGFPKGETPICVEADGRLGRLRHGETVPKASVALDSAPPVVFATQAKGAFERICVRETGVSRDLDKDLEARSKRQCVAEQSHEIAGRLESQGVKAYRDDKWRIWRYFVQSGGVEALASFRRICFIPAVAESIRRPVLHALEALCEQETWLRFATFTGGSRVKLCQVRRAIRELIRRISRLNAEPWFAAEAEIVFRAIELGTPERSRKGKGAFGISKDEENARLNAGQNGRFDEGGEIERDENGVFWFHPHAHVAWRLKNGPMPAAKWEAFLKRIWAYWGDQWDEGGVIREPREACKYVTKPGAVLALPAPELAELSRQLSRLKLVQPMGKLADEIARRERDRLRLERSPTPDGYVWTEVPDWNRRYLPKLELGDVAILSDGTEVDVSLADTEAIHAAAAKRANPGEHGRAVCAVVSKCVPSFGPINRKEPAVIVCGNVFDRAAVEKNETVVRIRELTAAKWAASAAAPLGSTKAHQLSGFQRGFDFEPNVTCRAAAREGPILAPPRLSGASEREQLTLV